MPGTAIRIASGAPMPSGAEAVVSLEFTDHGIAQVALRTAPASGENIRRRAEDVAQGDTVLRSGTRIGARQMALLAGVGRDRVLVHPRPRVVIISIGDEIVEPGGEARPGTVFDATVTPCQPPLLTPAHRPSALRPSRMSALACAKPSRISWCART